MNIDAPEALGSTYLAVAEQMAGYPEVETDGRGGATMIWPGETEAGSAGTQTC